MSSMPERNADIDAIVRIVDSVEQDMAALSVSLPPPLQDNVQPGEVDAQGGLVIDDSTAYMIGRMMERFSPPNVKSQGDFVLAHVWRKGKPVAAGADTVGAETGFIGGDMNMALVDNIETQGGGEVVATVAVPEQQQQQQPPQQQPQPSTEAGPSTASDLAERRSRLRKLPSSLRLFRGRNSNAAAVGNVAPELMESVRRRPPYVEYSSSDSSDSEEYYYTSEASRLWHWVGRRFRCKSKSKRH